MKKSNKIIILSITCVIFLVVLIIFILNYSKDDSSFSLLEKKWLNDNINKVIDVDVFNDIPIYGEDGSGLIFDYLDEFTKEHNIDFNKISYLSSKTPEYKDVAFRILSYNEELTDNDILIKEDHYVLFSKSNQSFDKLEDITDISIGVLEEDMQNVSYFFGSDNNNSYKSYESVDKMLESFKNGEINYLALPLIMNLDIMLENDLYVNYHLGELTKKYVLTIKDSTLLSIMKKYQITYEDDYYDDVYQSYFLETFFDAKDISESEKMSYNSSTYNYGYVINMPYENIIKDDFVGTLSNYILGFEKLADVDINLIKYNTIDELKQAYSNGDIDFMFAYFPMNEDKSNLLTVSPFNERFVVLAENNLVLNSLRGLYNQEVSVTEGTYLYTLVSTATKNVKSYSDTDELLRNINHDDIVVIDEATYRYYQKYKFSDFKVVYLGELNDDYQFVIKDSDKNKTFSELFNCYVSMIDYQYYQDSYHTDYMIHGSSNLKELLVKVLTTLGIIVIICLLIYFILKKKKKKKKNMKKEDKYKFIDVMTSLKNRNYLNYNLKKWDDNVIYPQAIIIVDLDNIKYINDNHGHAEGDRVIKQAANILMMNQLENTDIVRTDGNEFLIYLVGYDEKAIITYARKLHKSLRELPYNFGATLGYSMILDDLKTIDDAINEATIAMRSAKK